MQKKKKTPRTGVGEPQMWGMQKCSTIKPPLDLSHFAGSVGHPSIGHRPVLVGKRRRRRAKRIWILTLHLR